MWQKPSPPNTLPEPWPVPTVFGDFRSQILAVSARPGLFHQIVTLERDGDC